MHVCVWILRSQKAVPPCTLFLPFTYVQAVAFLREIMRLRVVRETIKPQGTHHLLGNIFVAVGTSLRVTTLSRHNDWPPCKRGADLSCIFTNDTDYAAAAAMRLFTLLRPWQCFPPHLPTVRHLIVLGGTASTRLLSDGLRVITRCLFVQDSIFINREVNPYVILYLKQY